MLSVWKRGIQTNPNPRETSLGAGSRFPKNDDCGAASIPPPNPSSSLASLHGKRGQKQQKIRVNKRA
jgi:hypothetical protein